MTIPSDDELERTRREVAGALWVNSTLGLLLHADSSSQSMQGRGRGSKAMLEALPILDVMSLDDRQLEAAEAIWRDFVDREFEAFYCCAIDPARIELDRRVMRDMLGLDSEAELTIKRLREFLAVEPSIHGSKEPELPAGDD